MKIRTYLMTVMLFANLSFAFDINPNYSLVSPDRCTNTNLANEAPNFNLPMIKKFKHHNNVILSAFFKPHHVIHDLVVTDQDAINIHAKFDYDWVLHKDLEDEYVHAYYFADGTEQWVYLGKYLTNKNGDVFIPLKDKLKVGDYLMRMVVEGDGSTVDGFISIINPDHEAIVFDIDGTLTLSDFEIVKDYLSIATALPYYYAAEVLEDYSQKGYELIFLTARPYWMAAMSRDWLKNVLFHDAWPLKTRNSLLMREGTAAYKANYLKELIREKHLKIIRAYGNAMTDIEAYALAGIPKEETYIIGPNAGKRGTNPIQKDYTNHFYEVVYPTPLAHCKSNPQ
ncbi:Uncharacterized protein involved in plasmid maintenance [Legionella beliardensis]|uniref:Uncharacterized protein involved in plasmid maintenance n=1 Tax=Legionella beliardensis TaxID=91822 RepID=A0A378I4Q8_9GAMM|nr:haloacid dehalogenase [Legionella beliardensis]STX29661.1 Uncharacterized protein involved in plasmid maintenance [Legionella beliardensis]